MKKTAQLEISHESVIPLHGQLLNQLRQCILSHRWKAGERIPSETELQRHLKISRSTIRQALGNAEVEGLIHRVPGRGTFVAEIQTQLNTKPPIAFVVFDFNRPMQRDMLSGAERAAREAGYRVVFCNSNSSAQQEIQIIQQLAADGVSGILLWASVEDDNPARLAQLSHTDFLPVTMMDRTFDNVNWDYVTSDNFGGGLSVANHLLELGHQSMAFLTSDVLNLYPVSERYRGYKTALYRANITPLEPWIIGEPNREIKAGYALEAYMDDDNPIVLQIANYLKENAGKVSAIFALNDNIALLTLKATNIIGLKVPDDISIVGYDDIDIASYLPKPLTTVAQDAFAIGRQAAELLIERIEGWYDGKPRTVTIPTTLRARASTTIQTLPTFD